MDHSSDSSFEGIDVESKTWVDSAIVTRKAHRNSTRSFSYMLPVFCDTGLAEPEFFRSESKSLLFRFNGF